MTVIQTECSECGKHVAVCDNNVRLDLPAVEWSREITGANWTIMSLGPMSMAAAGGPGTDGLAHTLHEHQPQENK